MNQPNQTNSTDEQCFLCQKHRGLQAQPPGGYIYRDALWNVCHAPCDKGPLGTLFIESQRHFLDFSEMNDEELHNYGSICNILYNALKKATLAERIYSIIFLEGIPHFHVWLIPRRAGEEKGIALISKDAQCNEQDAITLSSQLKHMLEKGPAT